MKWEILNNSLCIGQTRAQDENMRVSFLKMHINKYWRLRSEVRVALDVRYVLPTYLKT